MPGILGGLIGSVAAASLAPGNAYQFLSTQVLSGNQSSINFSNLNATYGSTYQHLQIRFSIRHSNNDTCLMARMNDDSNGANYHGVYLNSGGGGIGQEQRTDTNSLIFFYTQDFAGADSSSFYAGVIDILDPFETTKNTTIRCLMGATGNNQKIGLATGGWFNTAALTSFGLSVGTGNPAPWQGSNFTANSRFSLYGLRGV